MTAFLIIGSTVILAFSLWAQWRVKSAFSEFRAVFAASGATGAQAAGVNQALDIAALTSVATFAATPFHLLRFLPITVQSREE